MMKQLSREIWKLSQSEKFWEEYTTSFSKNVIVILLIKCQTIKLNFFNNEK